MIAISDETYQRLQATFPLEAQAMAYHMLLNECGDNLPLVETAYAQLAERIRFAVIKLSGGDLAELRKWITQAQTDWRDVLVAAGFAQGVNDHLKWRAGAGV